MQDTRPDQAAMHRVHVNDTELACEVVGSSEPMLFIHGSVIADALAPLAREHALDGYKRIRYRRRGYASVTKAVRPAPTTVGEQADDAIALLDHLGIEQAHLVGHSLGGAIALELAARHPDRVSSLVLLEPALAEAVSDSGTLTFFTPILERYTAGDARGAVEAFLAATGRPDWREAIESAAPGAVDRAVRDAAVFFDSEVPAIMALVFAREDAALIRCPVLSVLGTATSALNLAGRPILHSWFPACQDADIPGATHLFPLEEPAAVAAAISAFVARARARA